MRTFAFILLAALGLVACTDELSAAEENYAGHEVTGAVHMPLTARGANGKNYRLRNATFEITGAAMFTVADRDAPRPDADSLVTTLPAGGYSLYLRPGWELVEQSADGTDLPTQASLTSKNPMTFEIGRTLDARVTLTVHAGDQDLQFGGSGPIKVTSAGIDEQGAL